MDSRLPASRPEPPEPPEPPAGVRFWIEILVTSASVVPQTTSVFR